MNRGGGIHTVPNPEGEGWANVRNGEVLTVHRTKVKAVGWGRNMARRRKEEHTVHNQNGQIAWKNSYGNDPFPPRDAAA